jgi:hypothetical protein
MAYFRLIFGARWARAVALSVGLNIVAASAVVAEPPAEASLLETDPADAAWLDPWRPIDELPAVEAGIDPSRSVAILPLGGIDAPPSNAWRKPLAAALDNAFAPWPADAVVDRATATPLFRLLRLTECGDRALALGQLSGAAVVVRASVQPIPDPARPHAAAVLPEVVTEARDTATGDVLFRQRTPIEGADSIRDAVASLVGAVEAALPRPKPAAELVFLPVYHQNALDGWNTTTRRPLDEVKTRVRRRLAEKVGRIEGLRVIAHELHEPVARAMHYRRASLGVPGRPVLIRDPAVVEITLFEPLPWQGDYDNLKPTQPAFPERPFGLKVAVRLGEAEHIFERHGTSAEGPAIEAAAATFIAQTVAALHDQPEPAAFAVTDADRTHWDDRALMDRLYYALADTKDGRFAHDAADPTKHDAIYEQVLARLEADPDDPLAVSAALSIARAFRHAHFLPEEGEGFDRGRLAALHHALLSRGPGDAEAIAAVEFFIYRTLVMTGKRDETASPAFREAHALARRMAERALEQDHSHAVGQNTFSVLVAGGDTSLALALMLRGMNVDDLRGWLMFNRAAAGALDHGYFDAAYQFARYQQRVYPAYELRYFDQKNKQGQTRLDKLANAGLMKKWRPLLATGINEQQRREQRETYDRLPTSPPKPDALPFDPQHVRSHPLPGGHDIMSLTATGDDAWAVLRSGHRYHLWRVGQPQTTEIFAMPEIVPKGQVRGYVMRPAAVPFGDEVYVAAEHLGLYRVVPLGGHADIMNDEHGLPAGASYHGLRRHDGKLYVIGFANDRGFVAVLREPGGRFEVSYEDLKLGPVRRVDDAGDGTWRMLHHDQSLVSVFDPEKLSWKQGWVAYDYVFHPTIFAAGAGMSLMFEPGESQDPMFVLHEDRPTRDAFVPVYYPPTRLTIYTISQTPHRWWWDRQIDPADDARRYAPLHGLPRDAVFAAGRFWVLDSSGALSSSVDGRVWTVPIQASDHGRFLAHAGDHLLIGQHGRVDAVDLGALVRQADAPDVARTGAQVRAAYRPRMTAWLAEATPMQRGAYFRELQRYDLAAEALLEAEPRDEPVWIEWVAEALVSADRQAEAARYLRREAEAGRVPDPMRSELTGPAVARVIETEDWGRLERWIERVGRGGVEPAGPAALAAEFNHHAAVRQLWRRWKDVDTGDGSGNEYLRRLWKLMYAPLPDHGWDWDADHTTRRAAWEYRAEAGQWLVSWLRWHKPHGWTEVVLDHPFLGPRRANYWGEYDLLIWDGRYEQAVRYAQSNDGKLATLTMAGRYDEAMKYPPDPDHAGTYEWKFAWRSAAATGRWEQMQRYEQRLRAAQRHDLQFDLLAAAREQDADAAAAWAHALGLDWGPPDPKATREAYLAVTERFEGALAAGHSAFRLGEFAWLVDHDRDAAKRWFDRAETVYLRHAGGPALQQAVARLRLGIIAAVFRDDPDAAREHFRLAAEGTGRAAEIAGWALAAAEDPTPQSRVLQGLPDRANLPDPTRYRRVELGGPRRQTLTFLAADDERTLREAWYYAPLGDLQRLFDREEWNEPEPGEPLDDWYYALGYPPEKTHPGIGFAYFDGPTAIDLIWCLVHTPPTDAE